MTIGDRPELREGHIVAGKYRVERVLGEGGMGVVVAAQHLQLDEPVAIKLLLPGTVASPDVIDRFLREARAAVKIKSEHVARVIDVDQLASGQPYMVMEYLEGSDLSALLSKRGQLPVGEAIDYLLQACEALAQAHALGIVHRDLKPANLFCAQRPDGTTTIKVLDFGISKIMTAGAPGHDMTRTTAVFGSPFYMSPEQLMASKRVDARTDLWSLGIILYELLAGEVPFGAEAVTELAIKIANEPVRPLSSVRPEVPSGLSDVIGRCLAKARDDRYPTVGHFAVALGAFGSREAAASVERIVGTLRKAGLWSDAPASGPLLPTHAATVPLVPRAPSYPELTGPASDPAFVRTDASWARTGPKPAPTAKVSKSFMVVVTAACALALVGTGLAVASRLHDRGATTASASTAPSPRATQEAPALGSASAAASDAPLAPHASASASAATSPTPTPSPSPAPAASAARTVARANTVTTPSRPVGPAPEKPAKPNCDPPWEVDAKGTRNYKSECL